VRPSPGCCLYSFPLAAPLAKPLFFGMPTSADRHAGAAGAAADFACAGLRPGSGCALLVIVGFCKALF
jgi:hypothetical protein